MTHTPFDSKEKWTKVTKQTLFLCKGHCSTIMWNQKRNFKMVSQILDPESNYTSVREKPSEYSKVNLCVKQDQIHEIRI